MSSMPALTLQNDVDDLLNQLADANHQFGRSYPGATSSRQPVHTVYGGAQLFRANIAQRLTTKAVQAFNEYGKDAFTFADACGISGASNLPVKKKERKALLEMFVKHPEKLQRSYPDAFHAITVFERVREKLTNEAVEDFRIDFEDGFGVRPDAEEDAEAVRCAKEVAKGLKEETLPAFIGIRIKPLNEELKARSIRTLDLFLSTLVQETGGQVPPNFVVTLPKIPIPQHASTLAAILTRLEKKLGLPINSVRIELMIELTQSLFDANGRFNLPLILTACQGRCVGAHFGTYDYTACCDITAAWQQMGHPSCQTALQMMKIAYAQTGIFLSDGATNILPVPLYRVDQNESLTKAQRTANREAIHAAWHLAFDNIQRSLQNAFYQGWDLHPAQLPIRYAACYDFFLRGFTQAASRLRNFVEKAAQATLVGDVFDDAATGQGLLNYFLRALNAGAVTLDELSVTGLSQAELETRSFMAIVQGRNSHTTSTD